jgi:hypothetical protein
MSSLEIKDILNKVESEFKDENLKIKNFLGQIK